ncbi:MAG: CoA ester lyase [Burkholderiales bacterium]|nr:CoA ester lyase [Burkholderiales bacterium]
MKPCRSLLFLPATAEHLWPKATERGADALVVDLEDSIPPDRKAAARPMARTAVADLARRGATVVLRVNAAPANWQQDLDGMPVDALATVMLPKVETPGQVDALAQALGALGGGHSPPITALIETPRGVLAARELAAHPALCALGFGAEDYAACLGVPASPAALSWPAHQVLTCAHAHGLQCWGLAASIAEIQDLAAFEQSVLAARAMGFTGSVCIHPRQVPVVNRSFSPNAEERAWAARIVDADHAARAAGLGAVLLDGRMVDKPIVDRARRWLDAPS